MRLSINSCLCVVLCLSFSWVVCSDITWDSPVLFGFDDSFLANQPGTVYYAAAVTADTGSNVFDQGITFETFQRVSFNAELSWVNFGQMTFNTDLDFVLRYGYSSSPENPLTLTALTPGVTYTVQLFACKDSTPFPIAADNQAYQGDGDVATSEFIPFQSTFYVIGTFTADSTTKVIHIIPDAADRLISISVVIVRAIPGDLCSIMSGSGGVCNQCVPFATASDAIGNCACNTNFIKVGQTCQLPLCLTPAVLDTTKCAVCVNNAALANDGTCSCATNYFRTVTNTCGGFSLNGGTVAENQPFTSVLTCPILFDATSFPGTQLQLDFLKQDFAFDYNTLPNNVVALTKCLTTGSFIWHTFAANVLPQGLYWNTYIIRDHTGYPIVTARAVVSVTAPLPACILSGTLTYDILGDGGALPGHTIQVNMKFQNIGLTTCVGVVLSSALPTELNYLYGSIFVNGLSQTDSLGDDSGEYDHAHRTIAVRIPSVDSGVLLSATFEAQIGCVTSTNLLNSMTVYGGSDAMSIGSLEVDDTIIVGVLQELDECTLVSACEGNPPCHDPDRTHCGTLVCGCGIGYQVDQNGICQNIDDCIGVDCGLNFHCVDGIESHTCECDHGFQLINGACVDINHCVGVICGDHQQCIDVDPDSFYCACVAPWIGDPEQGPCTLGECVNLDGDCSTVACCDGGICSNLQFPDDDAVCSTPCDASDCSNNGVPGLNEIKGFCTCTCNSAFFFGPTCQACPVIDNCATPVPCSTTANNIALCQTCSPNFELSVDGTQCLPPVDDCMGVDCGSNAHCVDGVHTYTCVCDSGYASTNGGPCLNVDDCPTITCGDHSYCVDGINSAICVCDSGFASTNGGPCLNVDDCPSITCGLHAHCVDGINSAICLCDFGFTLINGECQTVGDTNLCSINNGGCGDHATCYGGVNGGDVTCVCVPGYYKATDGSCVGVNACATNNGNCNANAICSTVLGTWDVHCQCKDGYQGNGWWCELPPVNLCATNNGGCDVNANCYGGVGGGAVTCVCFTGYYQDTQGGCTAINACATNHGGCDVHADCTTTLATWSVTCTCQDGYEGNGYYCAIPSETNPTGGNTGGTGDNSHWDCPSPPGSFWDWRYPEPTCAWLTINYPADLPAGQANDINVRIRTTLHGDITLNFHNNNGYWSGTYTVYFRDHPNFPTDVTSYEVVWVQVGGTNCHWTGDLQCNFVAGNVNHDIIGLSAAFGMAPSLLLIITFAIAAFIGL